MNKEVALAINAINAAATVLTDKRKSKSAPARELNSAFWSKKKPSVEDEEILAPKMPEGFKPPKWLQKELEENESLNKQAAKEIALLRKKIKEGDSAGFAEDEDEEDEIAVKDEDLIESEDEDPTEVAEPPAAEPAAEAPKTVKKTVKVKDEKIAIAKEFDAFVNDPLDVDVQSKVFNAIENYIRTMTKVKKAKEEKEKKEAEAEQEAAAAKAADLAKNPMGLVLDLAGERKTMASVNASLRYFQRHGRLP